MSLHPGAASGKSFFGPDFNPTEALKVSQVLKSVEGLISVTEGQSAGLIFQESNNNINEGGGGAGGQDVDENEAEDMLTPNGLARTPTSHKKRLDHRY